MINNFENIVKPFPKRSHRNIKLKSKSGEELRLNVKPVFWASSRRYETNLKRYKFNEHPVYGVLDRAFKPKLSKKSLRLKALNFALEKAYGLTPNQIRLKKSISRIE